MQPFLIDIAFIFVGLVVLAMFSRMAYAVTKSVTRAPLLDVFISFFTWIPWVAGAWLSGWLGVLAALTSQFLAIHAFCVIDRVIRGKQGRTLPDAQAAVLGPVRNHLALLATTPAVLLFVICRAIEILVYTPVAYLAKLPRYSQGDWVNLSRHKYDGLIGVLRNIESFWCPIRFRNDVKNQNALIDFPDIEKWPKADGTMEDAGWLEAKKREVSTAHEKQRSKSQPVDFLCIGAQKAATTWLMVNLSKHPGVWTPRFIKELHYFDVVHLATKRAQVLKIYNRNGIKFVDKNPKFKSYMDRITDPSFAFTDAWYEHVFSVKKRNALAGECTPLYCSLPDEGVAHVKRLCPNLRIIYMIRDPFSRMMSSLRMRMDRQKATDCSQIADILDDSLFLARGDYRSNIPRWENQFEEGNILYIPFLKVKNDPMGVLRDVEKHLGLKAFDFYPKFASQVHPTKEENKNFDEALIQRVRDIVAPQYEYITAKWGTEFVEASR